MQRDRLEHDTDDHRRDPSQPNGPAEQVDDKPEAKPPATGRADRATAL
jgi:hypothetical protein